MGIRKKLIVYLSQHFLILHLVNMPQELLSVLKKQCLNEVGHTANRPDNGVLLCRVGAGTATLFVAGSTECGAVPNL